MVKLAQGAAPPWDPPPSAPLTDATLRSRPEWSSREGRERTVRAAVLRQLAPFGPRLLCVRSLVLWERPLYSAALHAAVSSVFWFFALSSFRPFFLICMGLAVTLCGKMWYSRTWCEIKSCLPKENESIFDRQKADHPGTPSVSGLSHDIAEVCVRASCFARSLLVYRRQNPGQFCFLACCFFTFLAMLGHCIPGLVLSYSTVLLVLFCPLVMNHGVWHQLSLPFELVLQWMDFSHHAYMKSKPKEFLCNFISDSEEELDTFHQKGTRKLPVTDTDASDTEVSSTDSVTFSDPGGQIPLSAESEGTDPSSSSSASMDAPSTAFFSCLDAGSLSTIQPHPTAGTSRECHSSVSTSQRHPQQPSFEPENEGEDFEMLDQLELNLMDPLEQKQQ